MTTKQSKPKLPTIPTDATDCHMVIFPDGLALHYTKELKQGKITAKVKCVAVVRKKIYFNQRKFGDSNTKPISYYLDGIGRSYGVSPKLALTIKWVEHWYQGWYEDSPLVGAGKRNETLYVTFDGFTISNHVYHGFHSTPLGDHAGDFHPRVDFGIQCLDDYLANMRAEYHITHDVTID